MRLRKAKKNTETFQGRKLDVTSRGNAYQDLSVAVTLGKGHLTRTVPLLEKCIFNTKYHREVARGTNIPTSLFPHSLFSYLYLPLDEPNQKPEGKKVLDNSLFTYFAHFKIGFFY